MAYKLVSANPTHAFNFKHENSVFYDIERLVAKCLSYQFFFVTGL